MQNWTKLIKLIKIKYSLPCRVTANILIIIINAKKTKHRCSGPNKFAYKCF